MLLVFLLREKALVALERCRAVLPADLFVSRENGGGSTDRAWELFPQAVRMQQYAEENWRICRAPKTGFGDPPFRFKRHS